MAFRRTKDVATTPTPHSVVASAARIDLKDLSWNSFKFRDEAWQRELWRLYDLVPEFRFAANWVGSCASRVRIYVAEVDDRGRPGAEVKDDPEVEALSDSLFGGPASKAEALRAIGINLTVGGECYTLAKGGAGSQDDKWMVLSPSELRRITIPDAGGRPSKQVAYEGRDGPGTVGASDILTRVWTPHPRRMKQADCPARACQPVLREIEQLTKYVFAQIDSRLVGAGLLPIPAGMDFPVDDGDSAADTLMMKLAEAGQASLKGEGTAAAVLPIIIEVPTDALGKIGLVNFASDLSEQALDLRKEAIHRFGTGMDMPVEVIQGTGQANHWNMWHIDETGVKVHIEPLMTRICEAVTRTFLEPALRVLGKDPARYTFWFDTSPLTVRPQRLTDALNLFEQNLLSGDAVREAGFFRPDEAPKDDENVKRFIRELMLRDPSLFTIQGVRELAGITTDMLPLELATPPPPPPAPDQGIQSSLPAPMPDQKGITANHPGTIAKAGNPNQISASAWSRDTALLVVAAEAAVLRALELAGGRLLDRQHRSTDYGLPRHQLHARITVNGLTHANQLLAGAWTHIPALVDVCGAPVDAGELQKLLHGYCSLLLVKQRLHEPALLQETIERSGLVDGNA